MNNLLISLLIGLCAATIDVVPMLIQRLEKPACISAFVQWLVLAFIIPYVAWDMIPWVKGMLIGEMAALPIVILVAVKDVRSVIPIVVFSAVLGAAQGWAGAKWIILN